LQVDATAGKPGDVGEAIRRDGLDTVFRVQGYHGPLVVGASHILTQPFQVGRWVTGRTEFTGLDARWMQGGVQLRGEWIAGRAFAGTSTKGGYLDAFVHRPVMGPFTAVLRVEKLDYVAATASRSRFFKRATVGGPGRIAGLPLAALTIVTGRVVESHALSRAAGDLSSAQAAFSHLISTRTQFVAAQTRLITALPVFRAHMIDVRLAADVATMEAMADPYRSDLSAAFCVVTDARGRWLASPGLDSPTGRLALDPAVRTAVGGQSHHEILA